MAKLNGVKTLDMVNGEVTRVEYNGEVYAKVDGKAQVGDIAVLKEGHFVVDGEVGAFYEVLIDGEGGAFIPTTYEGQIDYVVSRGHGAIFRKEFVTIEPSPISVGDTVKLTIAKGKRPYYSWGLVKNGEVGKVVKVSGEKAYVDFPSQKHWTALLTELTKVEGEPGEQPSETYRLVTDRDPKVGDFVKYADNDNDVTAGKYYEVTEIDKDGDLEFTDDAGDTNVAISDYEVFEVYEKINGEPMVEYREVKREAKVGELIKIVDAYGPSGYENGDIRKVTKVNPETSVRHASVLIEPDNAKVLTSEYVVLEPIEQPDTLAHNGATYTLVDRKAQPGDVVVFTETKGEWFETNTPYLVEEGVRVTNVRNNAEVYKDSVNRTVDNVKVFEPTVAPKAKEQPLMDGDYAKVADHVKHDGYAGAGDILRLRSNIGGYYDFKASKITDESVYTLFNRSELVKATDEEVAEAKAQAKFASISEGDYVKIADEIHGHNFDIGEIVVIEAKRDDDFRAEKLDGSESWYITVEEFEKLSASSAEQIIAEQAEKEARRKEDAKWVAIGRKPNEFKKGDIVITHDRHNGLKDVIGEIAMDEVSDRPLVKARNDRGRTTSLYSHSSLITPVEARFDNADA